MVWYGMLVCSAQTTFQIVGVDDFTSIHMHEMMKHIWTIFVFYYFYIKAKI